MNFEKIKEILKNKKVQIITGSIAVALLVTLAGTMVLHNKNVENKNVAIERNTEKEKKKDINKEDKTSKDKEKDKEQLEELKKIDTSKLSDEEKKDLENKIADVEKKIENDDNSGSSKEVASNTSNTTSNSTSDKNNVAQNNNTSSNTNNNTNQTKPNNKNEHTHNWVPITNVVHHDQVGHSEDVLVSAAWTESIPVYEAQARDICNTCNTNLTGTNISAHVKKHMMAGEDRGGHRTEWVDVQVDTNTINHPAVYDKKWVVDKAAWDETVTTGYKCSSCGETK
jgi:superfamily II DNA/RNA helicase